MELLLDILIVISNIYNAVENMCILGFVVGSAFKLKLFIYSFWKLRLHVVNESNLRHAI